MLSPQLVLRRPPTMKAAYLENTGGPEVLQYGDLPTPQPKQGEVLVRVQAAALNPIDTYIRAGAVNMPLPKPFITGTDLAGGGGKVGAGTQRVQPGDRGSGAHPGLFGRPGPRAGVGRGPAAW